MIAEHSLKRVSVIDAAASHLKNLILDGTLEPGRVLTEKELVDSWSISRPTVRMAFRDVLRLDLITQQPNHSAGVRVFTPHYMLELEPTRRVVEGAITADFLSDLTELPDRLKTLLAVGINAVSTERGVTPESRKKIRDHESAFHSALIGILSNERVNDMYKIYDSAMIACGNQLDVSYDSKRLAIDHNELVTQAELTTAGADPAQFEEMMRVHLGDLALQLHEQL